MMNSTRRSFLKAGSLTVAFALSPVTHPLAQTAAAPVLPGSLNSNRALDGWIRINPNATVTMFTGKVELGQGILTALTQIVCDELDVALARIEVVSGHTARTPNEGVTSGSLSVQDSGTALAYACAEARSILLAAAAARLGVAADTLSVTDGSIRASGGGQTSYWELTSDTLLKREATAKVALKQPAQHKLIGQSLPRRDIRAKLTGAPAYVQDIRMEGMVHGRVVRPSAPRARLISFDEAAIKAMPGVLAVVRDGSFLAVAARREEQAIAAARALQSGARWQEPGDLPPAAPTLYAWMKTRPTQDSVVSEIKPPAVPAARARTLQAEYTRPWTAHASIGPSCALAQWKDGKLSVWCHSQGVFPLRGDLARALQVPPASITVMHAEGAGCYGQNGADDVALDAALLARALPGTPVRLQWMREDEFGWEPLSSPMAIRLQASLDEGGRIVDWNHELWSYTHSTRPGDRDGCNLLAAWHLEKPQPPGPSRNIPQPSGGSDRNAVPLYEFPQQKVTNHLLTEQPIRTSALRTLGAYANVFAAESFMDELAAAAKADPLQFRLQHMKDPRARAVLERVGAMAQWQAGAAAAPAQGPARGRGVAFAKYKNMAVYCAVVVDVLVDRTSGVIRVERAWSAVDAGLVINPDGLRNQIEGGIVQATSWTLHEAMGNSATRTSVRNWNDYPILRFAEVPQVQVDLINRPEERPLGVGEGSHGPTVAAIANAVAQATGRRLRDLPLTPQRVLAASA